MVSVMAECVKNLQYLNARLLAIPKPSPNPKDAAAKPMKFPMIINGVATVNSAVERPLTVLNRMMLTISLKTPSP